MTDHTELRKLANEADQIGIGWTRHDGDKMNVYSTFPFGDDFHIARFYDDVCADFSVAANPATILSLLERLEKAEKDAARLDWLQAKLFTQRWNGVVGQGCLTQWSIAPDYRHSLTTMQTSDIEIDFRGAIDRAMEASK